ncbi:MAG: molybdenum ABC transporter ATP-binding protein [Pseudomonadota bacterium]
MTLRVEIEHRLGDFSLDVAFAAPPGVTVLFGRSGAGKTSVVHAVAGLLRPDRGRIEIAGQVVLDTAQRIDRPTARRRLGYIFQDGRLFPHLTVRGNLLYGRRFTPVGAGEPSLEHVVAMLGIAPLLDRRPAGLSGGERARVAIGRALLARPLLILADEPLAALDAARKAEILPYLERLRDETDVPILYVSHAAEEVARLATTVIALEAGRVVRQGPASDVLADPTVTPLGAREAGAVLTVRVAQHHNDGLTELDAGGLPLFLPHIGRAPGTALRVRLPANDVILARGRPEGLSALNILPATVRAVREGEGPGALISLDTAAGAVLARVTRRSVSALSLAEGANVYAIVKSIAVAPGNVGS